MEKHKINHKPVMDNAAENKWAVSSEILKKIRKWAVETGTGKPLAVAYLDLYIKKCAAPTKTKIDQSKLAKLHNEVKESFSDPKNNARTYMKNTFRPFLKKYFETEGKDLPYELTIPLGRYNNVELIKRSPVKDSPSEKTVSKRMENEVLLTDRSSDEKTVPEKRENEVLLTDRSSDEKTVPEKRENEVLLTDRSSDEKTVPEQRENEAPLTDRPSDQTNIIYQVDKEKHSFKLPGNPLIYLMLTWSFGSFFFIKTTSYLLFQPKADVNVALVILLIFISAAIGVVAIALTSIVIEKKIFRPAFGKTRFFKLTDEGILFASYCGVCLSPDCKGKVELTNKKHIEGNKRSYIGVCKGNPDLHLYTFDHVNMRGKFICWLNDQRGHSAVDWMS